MKIVTIATKKNVKKTMYIEWSKEVRTRDNWECCVCGTTIRSNAHHIIPREIKEWTFTVDNGITLCVKHHKFSRILSAHNNPIAFFLWFKVARPIQFSIAEARNQKLQEWNE